LKCCGLRVMLEKVRGGLYRFIVTGDAGRLYHARTDFENNATVGIRDFLRARNRLKTSCIERREK
jgi:hypothetical protein